MDSKLLDLFCANDETRPRLTVPFNIGNYTYCTNGHVAIRVDKQDEFSENTPVDGILVVGFKEDVPEELYIDLPDISDRVAEEKCSECNGAGENQLCIDCEGSGYVSWESESGIEYKADCKQCKRSGHMTGKCDWCDGRGYTVNCAYIEIGTKLLQGRYLHFIAKLPNAKIAVAAVEGLKPVPFKFDGGIGIIMPMRRHDQESTSN